MSARPMRGYVVPGTLRWVIDLDRVVVVDTAAEKAFVLRGKQAATWRLLVAGRGCDELASFFARASRTSTKRCRREVLDTFGRWMARGLLVPISELDDG